MYSVLCTWHLDQCTTKQDGEKRSTKSQNVWESKIVKIMSEDDQDMDNKEEKGGQAQREVMLCNSLSVLKQCSYLHFTAFTLYCHNISVLLLVLGFFVHCPPLFSIFSPNSISLLSFLTTWFRFTGQLQPGPHQRPFNHRAYTQLFSLPSLLLFWTQLDHCIVGTLKNSSLSSSAFWRWSTCHTCMHVLQCRWAVRSNLFVWRWLEFLCHRTLGLQINIPGLTGSQVCFETEDRHFGIMADAWREFFKTRSALSL